MKLGRDKGVNPECDTTREEVREIAGAVSLYRSAMRHIAEREAARPFVMERRSVRTIRFGLLLAPALAAAVAAGVLVPVYSHLHHPTTAPGHDSGRAVAVDAAQKNQGNVATVDDTALMNQIDSELSEDVPDALQPLADLSDQTINTSVVSEKKNVTTE